jgi:uncharacterized integral membrane protein (TIGR00698 family)
MLLGARMTFAQLTSIGADAVLLTVGALALSFAAGAGLSHVLKLDRGQGVILAGATAICGVSAALAFAAAMPKSRQGDAVAAIAGVTVIGTACMVTHPAAAHALQFDDVTTGVFLGATLHEVAQAVGAGFSVSAVAGETATAVKLLRVSCLGPALLLVAYVVRCEASRIQLPWFILGFAGLAALASLGLLPASAVASAGIVSQWLLLTAVAGLGLKMSPACFGAIGARSFLVIAAQSLFLAFAVGGALVSMR